MESQRDVSNQHVEGKFKADWDKQNTHIFCDICIQAIHIGMRPSTHFNSRGWKYLISEFEKRTNCKLEKTQLKNKWDQLKNTWKKWRQLIGQETGLGWNPYKGTIEADEEWWAQKLKVDPIFSKFKKEGIEPELSSKYDIMFGDILATGYHAWTPSQMTQNTVQDYSDSHSIPCADDTINLDASINCNFEDLDQTLDDVLGGASQEKQHMMHEGLSNTAEKVPKRRKTGGRKVGYAQGLRDDIKNLVQSVQSSASVTSRLVDPPGCAMGEVIANLKTIPEIKVNKELYFFALDLLQEKIRRETYAALETEEKLEWLQYKFNKGKNNP